VDQKTALKCIQSAGKTIENYKVDKLTYITGFLPMVVPNILEGDEVRTDMIALERLVQEIGKEDILCVLSCTSTFAPRSPDKYEYKRIKCENIFYYARVIEIAKLCKTYGIAHVINNAYGLQSSKYTHLISEAIRQVCNTLKSLYLCTLLHRAKWMHSFKVQIRI
jgi:hypothetical protein